MNYEHKLPNYDYEVPNWALSYLVNGDSSSLTDEEIEMCDEWNRKVKPDFIQVVDSDNFGRIVGPYWGNQRCSYSHVLTHFRYKAVVKGKIELPELSCKYGAPMGRQDQQIWGKVYMQKVPFVDLAYDRGGAYWGMPANLYVACDYESKMAFVRARNREEAKEKFQNLYDVSFFK